MDPQPRVHLAREQRERGAEERAEDRARGEHGRRVDGVRIHEIVETGHEDEDGAEAEGRRESDARRPGRGGGVGPRECEHADRQGQGADHAGREAGFRGRRAGGGEAGVPAVVEDGVDETGEHAEREAEECEAGDTGVPAPVGLVDDGKGPHEHVDSPVKDSEVGGGDEDDGFGEEEDPGPLEGFGEDGRGGLGAEVEFEDAGVGFGGVVA